MVAQVGAAIVIGLLVGFIVAPWSVLLEAGGLTKLAAIFGIVASTLYTAFLVYLGLGFLILTSWLVEGYSRTLNGAYRKGKRAEVGYLLGAPTGAIAAVVWAYNQYSTGEIVAFFFGGGLVGLWAGFIVAIIYDRLIIRR